MKLSTVFTMLGLALSLTPAIYSAAISPNLNLVVGDLNFDQFSCAVTHEGTAFPNNCLGSSMNVETINHPGNGIQILSGFTALRDSFSNAVINYHVSSASGINFVGLDFNGIFEGEAISSVTESIYNSRGTQVGFAQVSCADQLYGGCHKSASIMLSGVLNDLYITKAINASSFEGQSQIGYVNQTFSLQSAPEPSTILMLGFGLAIAGLLGLRAKSQIGTN